MIRIAPALVILGALLILPAYGANIQVFNYSSYINSSGMPVVVGEIINYGSESVRSVEVQISFVDGTGHVIDSSKVTAVAGIIPPGHRSPFMLVGSSDYASQVKSYDLQITNFVGTRNKPTALQLVSANEFFDGIREIGIWGEIKNVGSKVATSTKVYATFYDDGGKVIGYSSAPTDPGVIEPDGKSSFTIQVDERISAIKSYSLFAESDQYLMETFGVKSLSNTSDTGNTVSISGLSVVDQDGKGAGRLALGDRFWIKSDLKNELSAEQEFTYIVQIKDADGLPVTINWVDGILTPNMAFAPKLSWFPEEEGIYFAEIFIWHDLENPVPLSSSIRTILLFVEG